MKSEENFQESQIVEVKGVTPRMFAEIVKVKDKYLIVKQLGSEKLFKLKKTLFTHDNLSRKR